MSTTGASTLTYTNTYAPGVHTVTVVTKNSTDSSPPSNQRTFTVGGGGVPNGLYSLVGKAATVQVTGTSTSASFLQQQADANNYLAIGRSGASLICRVVSSGVASDETFAYSATNDLWRQIAVSSSGVLTFSVSPDGSAWTLLRTVTDPDAYPPVNSITWVTTGSASYSNGSVA